MNEQHRRKYNYPVVMRCDDCGEERQHVYHIKATYCRACLGRSLTVISDQEGPVGPYPQRSEFERPTGPVQGQQNF